MAKPLIGVALGGGAARGWAHIGVLKALANAGLAPDIVAGTSIGAVAGGCYAAGMLDELEGFVSSLTVRRIFRYLDFNFTGSGLLAGNRLCKVFDEHLEGIQIENMDKRFTAVATELRTGHEIWLNKGSLVSAMHASYALPGVFKPVCIQGRWLMDGALVNPIPVSVCRALGARLVIAVNLNYDVFGKGAVIPDHQTATPGPYPEEEAKDMKLSEGNERAVMRLLRRQVTNRGNGSPPGITTVMVEAFNVTQDRIARARLAGDPPDVTITPRMSGIGMFDFHRGAEAIPLGEEATLRALEEIDLSAQALSPVMA